MTESISTAQALFDSACRFVESALSNEAHAVYEGVADDADARALTHSALTEFRGVLNRGTVFAFDESSLSYVTDIANEVGNAEKSALPASTYAPVVFISHEMLVAVECISYLDDLQDPLHLSAMQYKMKKLAAEKREGIDLSAESITGVARFFVFDMGSDARITLPISRLTQHVCGFGQHAEGHFVLQDNHCSVISGIPDENILIMTDSSVADENQVKNHGGDPVECCSGGARAQQGFAMLHGLFHLLDRPTHYIVQQTPAHVAKNPNKYKNRAKLARFNDRDRWLLYTPDDVKKSWPKQEHQGGTHSSPVPHMRKGHTKVLSHERYRNKRGQIIHIRPTWVGARDWSNGRAKYKVISRAGAEADQA